jgi:hypothetical protein
LPDTDDETSDLNAALWYLGEMHSPLVGDDDRDLLQDESVGTGINPGRTNRHELIKSLRPTQLTNSLFSRIVTPWQLLWALPIEQPLRYYRDE